MFQFVDLLHLFTNTSISSFIYGKVMYALENVCFGKIKCLNRLLALSDMGDAGPSIAWGGSI